jgi:hypothetical protein
VLEVLTRNAVQEKGSAWEKTCTVYGILASIGPGIRGYLGQNMYDFLQNPHITSRVTPVP